MALIKCSGCGHMISDRAARCPKCGHPARQPSEPEQAAARPASARAGRPPRLKRKRKGAWIAVVIAVVVVCGGGGYALYYKFHKEQTNALSDAEAPADAYAAPDADGTFAPEDAGDGPVPQDATPVLPDGADEGREAITLMGSMTDENGTYPIKLEFEKAGAELTNCVYTNVDMGGKIRMDGYIDGSEFIFTGKDGNYTFQIRIDGHSYDGIATDGPKTLSVSLDKSAPTARSARSSLSTPADEARTETSPAERSVNSRHVADATSRPVENTVPDDEVYTVVEQPPSFPGGEAALLKYISDHLRYPQTAMDEDIQGVVTVRFAVRANGSVGEVHIVQGLDPACDAEAVRVVKSLPRFNPGRQQGRPVAVWFTLPIRFQLS